ncbi:MAG: sensor histidine kinase [Actinoplanes sp.]
MTGRSPWLADALLGLAVTGTLTLVISARQGGTQQPDAVAYSWAAGLGALMLARRRHPRAVLLISALGLFAYYTAGYPAVGVAVPLAAALFSTAEAGRLGAAIGVAAGVLAVSLAVRLLHGQDAAYVVGYELVSHVTLMAAAIALGDSLRSRRTRRAQEAEQRVREERLAIARELHDSIGHTVAVISLHADVAREAAPPDDEVLAAALGRIKQAAGETMRELRGAVGVLRSARTHSLTGLDAVLDTARAAGFDVLAHVTPEPGELPPAVDAAAYRIVQEAVTNVLRHARAGLVEVAVVADGRTLRVTVTDDGPPPHRAAPAGDGIAGMTERARALGGSLRTRHGPAGFVVEAELPL